jgi:hypothetical protein
MSNGVVDVERQGARRTVGDGPHLDLPFRRTNGSERLAANTRAM